MKLHEYLKSLSEAEFTALAERAKIAPSYLIQLRCHTENQKRLGKHPSAKLSVKLASLTGGAVTLAELRPDLWGHGVARLIESA